MEGLQKLSNALSNGGRRGSGSLGFTTPPKTLIAIISGMGKANWPDYSQCPSERISLKILEKRERGHIQRLPKCFGYPLLYRARVKLQTSSFAQTYRVGQIKRGHFTFLLVTHEFMYQILCFLAHINCKKQRMARCQHYVNKCITHQVAPRVCTRARLMEDTFPAMS